MKSILSNTLFMPTIPLGAWIERTLRKRGRSKASVVELDSNCTICFKLEDVA